MQQYVANILDGVTAPDFDACAVYIAPPQAAAAASPCIFVWGFRDHETRRTFPRGKGFRTVEYSLYLWVKAFIEGGSPRESVAFPLLLDAIKQVLRVTPLGAAITDPDTEQVSTIQSIGEDMQTDFPGPRDVTPQGVRLYEASINAMVIEDKIG